MNRGDDAVRKVHRILETGVGRKAVRKSSAFSVYLPQKDDKQACCENLFCSVPVCSGSDRIKRS
jgi:hypothetical protein